MLSFIEIIISIACIFSLVLLKTYTAPNVGRALSLLLVVIFSSLSIVTVEYFRPGDYNVYIHFFKQCSLSEEHCINANTFEPGFYWLTFYITHYLGVNGEDMWKCYCVLYYLLMANAIANSRSIAKLSHSEGLSLFLLVATYAFTNLGTLAIRFGLSFVLFLNGILLMSKSRHLFGYLNALGFSIVLTSCIIHFQAIFLLPTLLFLKRDISVITRYVVPVTYRFEMSISKSGISLSLVRFFLVVTILLCLLIPFSSQVLVAAGKSYYLSNYQSNSLGLRSIAEAVMITIIVLPLLVRQTIRSSHIVQHPLFMSVVYMFYFSLFCSYVSLLLFSIDGLARQVQALFIMMIIVLYARTRSLRKVTLAHLAIAVYIPALTLYTLVSDPSFGY